MPLTERQQFLVEATSARDRARDLLRAILAAHAESESHSGRGRRADLIKVITGRSAMENAAARTRQMIETLDRAIQEAAEELSDDGLGAQDEAEELVTVRAAVARCAAAGV